MLVISRKAGEKIRIGPDIIVTIVRAGNKVRVGIQAPDEVSINRGELVGLLPDPPLDWRFQPMARKGVAHG